jgi:hypothetical protein
MVCFLILVVPLLPSGSVLSDLVEHGAVRAAPATSLSIIVVSGISTKKLNYSLKTIQPLSELNTNSKELTFIQTGIASGNLLTNFLSENT